MIDAHALCYRAFYAIKGLSNSSGQSTNAVYGFLSTLRKILREYSPHYMAVCFDSSRKTYRQEKYAEYKIQRPAMPDELRSQIPIIKDIVKAYNIPIFEMGGFEADDIIATLAQQASSHGLEIVVVTEDKDMFQLAADNISLLRPYEDKLLNAAQVEERLGFPPLRIVDFIALAGDASDNIPGVKGIGKVTAEKLIRQFGTIENILENIEKIEPQRYGKMIAEQKESALISKSLAVLEKNVPFQLEPDQMRLSKPDTKRLYELFKQLEFRKLAEEIESAEDGGKIIEEIVKVNKRGSEGFLPLLEDTDRFALFITENTVWVSINGIDVYEFEFKEIKLMEKFFADERITKITYDAKEVYKALPQTVFKNVFDVMLAAYLLNPAKANITVKELAWDYLHAGIEGSEPGECVSVISKLYGLLDQQMEQKELSGLFNDIEMPLAAVLAEMEMHGVNIDKDYLKILSDKCEKKISSLTKAIYEKSGGEFNLNSPKQLCTVLFEKLKLPVVKKTKTGFSTDEEVLNKLALQHDVPALILEYRQIAKLKSTYIDALPALIDASTGRVHTQFRQTVTETGRLSSQQPNLQNIPVRTEMGREIRRAFIPSGPDKVLLAADYSQIELRILAHLSGDEELIKAFRSGEDIHTYTAALVFNVDERDVTREMRYSAKRVNFGIVYGMSAFGLAKDIGVSQKEAASFIEKYFSRYPKVKEYMDKQIEQCEKNGYVTTVLNRRRYIPEIKSKNQALRQFAQRQAINAPVQGSAADLMKLAMVDIHREMAEKKLTSRMLITVHDELVFDTIAEELHSLKELVKNRMEKAITLTLPLLVNIKTGKNWLEMN